jgi:hypothetical protein
MMVVLVVMEVMVAGSTTSINDDDFSFMTAEADDDNALVVVEFESQLLEAIKQDPDLSCACSNYVEFRKKVLMKKTYRGFWPVKNKFSGSKWGGKGFKGLSLAARISISKCVICQQKGHWKYECPKAGSAQANMTVDSSTV